MISNKQYKCLQIKSWLSCTTTTWLYPSLWLWVRRSSRCLSPLITTPMRRSHDPTTASIHQHGGMITTFSLALCNYLLILSPLVGSLLPILNLCSNSVSQESTWSRLLNVIKKAMSILLSPNSSIFLNHKSLYLCLKLINLCSQTVNSILPWHIML